MVRNQTRISILFSLIAQGQGMRATKLICTQCCPKENCLYGFSEQTNSFQFNSDNTNEGSSTVPRSTLISEICCPVLFLFTFSICHPHSLSLHPTLCSAQLFFLSLKQTYSDLKKKNEDAAAIQRSGAKSL